MISEQLEEAERPAFERWCKEHNYPVTKIMEAYDTRLTYASAYVQGRWEGWISRAALSPSCGNESMVKT